MQADPITRRHLLQRIGMLGGSSLLIGAMDAWGLRGASLGGKPILEGRQPTTRVIVLGAGLSGLVLGYELGKLGYDYRVLEARDWVGGLTWTVRRGTAQRGTAQRNNCTRTMRASRDMVAVLPEPRKREHGRARSRRTAT